jgi:hypothetical protein
MQRKTGRICGLFCFGLSLILASPGLPDSAFFHHFTTVYPSVFHPFAMNISNRFVSRLDAACTM